MAKKVAIVDADEYGLLGTLVKGVTVTQKEIKEIAKSLGMPTNPKQYLNIVPVRTEPKQGRNHPCECGSGKKYKKCCINK